MSKKDLKFVGIIVAVAALIGVIMLVVKLTSKPDVYKRQQLGNELADVIHYVLAIAALNGLDMNDIIIEKDKKASIKYHHETNLEQFVMQLRKDKKA